MDFIGKKMRWMTGKSEYEATFAEFAAANLLNYEYFSDGVDVYNKDIFENIVVFYEPGTSNATIMNWLAAGLRHHLAALTTSSDIPLCLKVIIRIRSENIIGM
jgi:hypothetical protein